MTEHGLPHEELQEELRDLLALAVAGDHVRWVLVGDEAVELADWLAHAVLQWRGLAHRVSRHLVTLGVAPDGRLRSLAKDISLNWVPEGWLRVDDARRLVASRVRIVGEWACYRRSQATDLDSLQLLDAVCATLKQQAQVTELMTVPHRARSSVPIEPARARRGDELEEAA